MGLFRQGHSFDIACLLLVKTAGGQESVGEDKPIADTKEVEKEGQSDDHSAIDETATADTHSEDTSDSKDAPIEDKMAEGTETQEGILHMEGQFCVAYLVKGNSY